LLQLGVYLAGFPGILRFHDWRTIVAVERVLFTTLHTQRRKLNTLPFLLPQAFTLSALGAEMVLSI